MIVVGCSGQLANLQGTVVEPARIAPNFELTNQHGNPISLDSFGGSVVLLSCQRDRHWLITGLHMSTLKV